MSTRLMRMVVGPVLFLTSKREDRRLAEGLTYEPQTFVERHNWVEDHAAGEKSNLVVMAQRGFRPSLENIAARWHCPKKRR